MGGSVSREMRSRGGGGSTAHVSEVLSVLRANPRTPLRVLEPLLAQVPRSDNVLAVHDDSGYNLLQRCVGLNHVDLVRWILTRHRCLDVNRSPCSLPLHIACYKGYEECVELLLRHGARTDTEARMCFPGTHHPNCEDYGKKSLSDGGVPTPRHCKLQSAIYYAIDGDRLSIMNALAQKMEKPWMPFRVRKPLLHIACERAAWKCVQHLVNVRSDELHTIKDENYPVHLAVLHDIKFLELLIAHGAETCVKTCTQQMTLLHIVLLIARKSAEETLCIVKFLLEHGCKEIINTPDGLGNTPLHALIIRYALEEAHYGCDRWNKWGVLNLARHLLQAGAGASINQHGNSALASALRNVRDWDVCYELLNMMLAHGGEPNNVGRDGSEPIMVCIVPLINKDPIHLPHSMKVCYLNCIRILLKYGANPNCSFLKFNLTPVHIIIFSIGENMALSCDTQKRSNFDFMQNLLLLLLQHGLDCNLKLVYEKQHILQSCCDIIHSVRSAEDMSCIYQLILTLIQHGANPDTQITDHTFPSLMYGQDPYSSSGGVYQYETAAAVENKNSFSYNTRNTILSYYITMITKKEQIMTDPDVNFAKVIYLLHFTMKPKTAYANLKNLCTQYIAQVPAKSTGNLVSVFKDLSRSPHTLKQLARYQIYKCIGRTPALSVNKLQLPSSLKKYILNFEV